MVLTLAEEKLSHTFWWGITALGVSILGAVVEIGTGRLDLGITAPPKKKEKKKRKK